MTAAASVVQPFSGEEKDSDDTRPSKGKCRLLDRRDQRIYQPI
jgi:hypothetical protein